MKSFVVAISGLWTDESTLGSRQLEFAPPKPNYGSRLIGLRSQALSDSVADLIQGDTAPSQEAAEQAVASAYRKSAPVAWQSRKRVYVKKH